MHKKNVQNLCVRVREGVPVAGGGGLVSCSWGGVEPWGGGVDLYNRPGHNTSTSPGLPGSSPPATGLAANPGARPGGGGGGGGGLRDPPRLEAAASLVTGCVRCGWVGSRKGLGVVVGGLRQGIAVNMDRKMTPDTPPHRPNDPPPLTKTNTAGVAFGGHRCCDQAFWKSEI